MRTAASIMLAITLFAGPAGAAMYKWKGADGSTQYGQHPPPGVQATRLSEPKPPKQAPGRTPLEEQIKALEERQKQQQEAAAEAEAKKREAAIRQQNCDNARRSLEQLSYGGNRLAAMPDGSYKRLTEAEKQEIRKKNQQAIEEFCD